MFLAVTPAVMFVCLELYILRRLNLVRSPASAEMRMTVPESSCPVHEPFAADSVSPAAIPLKSYPDRKLNDVLSAASAPVPSVPGAAAGGYRYDVRTPNPKFPILDVYSTVSSWIMSDMRRPSAPNAVCDTDRIVCSATEVSAGLRSGRGMRLRSVVRVSAYDLPVVRKTAAMHRIRKFPGLMERYYTPTWAGNSAAA